MKTFIAAASVLMMGSITMSDAAAMGYDYSTGYHTGMPSNRPYGTLDEAFRQADADGNWRLDRGEYTRFVATHSPMLAGDAGGTRREAAPGILTTSAFAERNRFNELDQDQDGFVSKIELSKIKM